MADFSSITPKEIIKDIDKHAEKELLDKSLKIILQKLLKGTKKSRLKLLMEIPENMILMSPHTFIKLPKKLKENILKWGEKNDTSYLL